MKKVDCFTHAEHFSDECRERIATLMNADADKQAIFKQMTGAERVVCTEHMGSMRMHDPTKKYNIFGTTDNERADTNADDRVYAALSFLFGNDATKLAFFAANKPEDTDIECVYYQCDRPDLINTWPFIRLRNRALGRVIVLHASEIYFRNAYTRNIENEISTLYYGYEPDNLQDPANPPIVNEYTYKRTPLTQRMMSNVFDVIWRVFDREMHLITALIRSAFHAHLFTQSRDFRDISFQCERDMWILTWDGSRMSICMNYMKDCAEIECKSFLAEDLPQASDQSDLRSRDLPLKYERFHINVQEAHTFATLYFRFAAHYFNNYIIALSPADLKKSDRAALTVFKRKTACIRRAIEKRE